MKGIIYSIIILLIISACSIQDNEMENSIMDLQIPEDFSFRMDKDVDLLIEMRNYTGEPITGVTYDISYINFNQDKRFILSANTSSGGVINENLTIPAYVEKLHISGYMMEKDLEIINDQATYYFSPPYQQREFADYVPPTLNRQFLYLPGIQYDELGVPDSVEVIGIDAELMARIGTSLPEHNNLPLDNPEYFQSSARRDFVFTDSADVWITFISEGASYTNALGYYTYDTVAGPPADPASLDLTLVYPNCSFVDEGGGMESGMKIYLGRFPGGTSMGWFLIRDGWISGSTVSEDSLRYYSENSYNVDGQHTVLLYDNEYESFVLGFEDRSRALGDNDFNDAVFLADANPLSNVDITGVPPIEIPPDTDEDGVSDPVDDYPEDPDRTYDVFYPNEEDYGTLVFEDLWPVYGDYDMNDMVLDYQYHLVTNADNEIVDITCNYSMRAIGASFDNGFALELPYPQSNMTLKGNSMNLAVYIQNYDKAVIDMFEHTTWLTMQETQTPYNTSNDDIHREPIDFYVSVELLTPAPLSTYEDFNPFIYQQGVYSHEIHLMNYAPTERMNDELFGTGNDASEPLNELFYLSATNLPWALNIPESWIYPEEKNSISDTYYHFNDWAESGGNLFPDWYLDVPGNYNDNLIYQKP